MRGCAWGMTLPSQAFPTTDPRTALGCCVAADEKREVNQNATGTFIFFKFPIADNRVLLETLLPSRGRETPCSPGFSPVSPLLLLSLLCGSSSSLRPGRLDPALSPVTSLFLHSPTFG